MQILYVLQGSSGSGKSTLAKIIKAGIENTSKDREICEICSTDDYHYIDGIYVFQPEKLNWFHKKNLERVKTFLAGGLSVVVDNTNIKVEYAAPYVKEAVDRNIPVIFIRVTSEFENTHGVPPDKVAKMKASLQDLSVTKCLEKLK